MQIMGVLQSVLLIFTDDCIKYSIKKNCVCLEVEMSKNITTQSIASVHTQNLSIIPIVTLTFDF